MAPKSRASASATVASGVKASSRQTSGTATNNAKAKLRGCDASGADANPWLQRKQDDQITNLAGMGFTAADARAALARHAWNLDQALDWLLANVELNDDLHVSATISETSCSSQHAASTALDNTCDEFSPSKMGQATLKATFEELPTEAGSSRASEGSDAEIVEEAAGSALAPARRTCPKHQTRSNKANSPLKQLMRARQVWHADADSNVLGVPQGSFVRIWTTTQTEHGWVYAELECDCDCAGWLPLAILQGAPDSCEWVRAVRSWSGGQGHMDVKEGCMLLLYTESRTELGWVYAISSEVKEFQRHAESEERGVQAGWVPDYCVFPPIA